MGPIAGLGPAFPVVEELTPAPDAWEVACRLSESPHLLFLDSGGHHPQLGRYSFVTAQPFARLWARGRQVWLDDQLLPTPDPFAALAEQLARHPAESIPDLPPFQGGAAGLLGYDLCHHIERLPQPGHHRRDGRHVRESDSALSGERVKGSAVLGACFFVLGAGASCVVLGAVHAKHEAPARST